MFVCRSALPSIWRRLKIPENAPPLHFIFVRNCVKPREKLQFIILSFIYVNNKEAKSKFQLPWELGSFFSADVTSRKLADPDSNTIDP